MALDSETTPLTQPLQAVPDQARAQERRERIRKLKEEKKIRAEKAAARKQISAQCSKEHVDRDKAKRRATIQTFFNRGGTALPKRRRSATSTDSGGAAEELQAGAAVGAAINILSSEEAIDFHCRGGILRRGVLSGFLWRARPRRAWRQPRRSVRG